MSGSASDDGDGVLFSLAPKGMSARSAAPEDEGAIVPLNRPIPSPLKVPYQNGKPLEQFGHGVGVGTRNVIEGVGSLPGMVADVATAIPRWGIRAAGGTVTAPSDIPVSDWLGLPKPQTEGENTRAEFIRGGASMLTPMGIAAKAPWLVSKIPALVRPFFTAPVENLPRTAAQTLSGGVGAITGDALAENRLTPEFLKPTARMAGNIIGGVGTNMLTGGIERAGNAFSGVKNDIAAALDRLKTTPTTAGQVSEGTGMKSAERTLQDTSFGSGTIRPAQEDFQNQFGKAVENTARDAEAGTQGGNLLPAGTYDTPQKTGVGIQGAFRRWIDQTFPAEQAQRWAPVDKVMGTAGPVVDVRGYLDALRRAVRDPDLASLPASQRTMASDKLNEWLQSLESDTANGTRPIDWRAAQSLRSRIGDALATPDLANSIGNKSLQNLYGSLANDMHTTAILKGVGREFEGANNYSLAGFTFRDNTLAKGVTGSNAVKESISAEDATKALLNGNSEDWQSLRLMIPEAADALAAFKLRQMKEAPLSRQMAGSTPSTEAFLSDLRGSQRDHPEGTAALFSNPKVAPQVQDLAALAEQIRRIRMSTPLPSGLKTALSATVVAPWLAAKAITNPATIAMTGARRAAPPPVPGLLGGALVNQATGQPARYDIDVRPQPQ